MRTQRLSVDRIARLVVGVGGSAVLMGYRSEFESVWIRSLMAGLAGAVFAACIIPMWQRQQRTAERRGPTDGHDEDG